MYEGIHHDRQLQHFVFTVEPPNKGHIGTRFFVLLREAAHFLEVTYVF